MGLPDLEAGQGNHRADRSAAPRYIHDFVERANHRGASGEQGRGFRVVAAQVRTLAARTAVAVDKIRDLVGKAQHRSAVIDPGKADTHRARGRDE